MLKVTKAREECCHHRHRPVTPECSLFQAQLAALPCHVLSFLRRNFKQQLSRLRISLPAISIIAEMIMGYIHTVLYIFGILKSVASTLSSLVLPRNGGIIFSSTVTQCIFSFSLFNRVTNQQQQATAFIVVSSPSHSPPSSNCIQCILNTSTGTAS